MTLLAAAALAAGGGGDPTPHAPIPYAFPTTLPYNVPNQALTPTPDGSGQAMHPSVIDFGAAGFNGWRYWMAMTPLPNGVEPLENPCILASNNGYDWRVPHGLTNPVYPWPGYSYNSDTDLVWDPATSQLVMVYKGPKEGTMFHLLYGRSSDGITWTKPPTRLTYAAGAAPTEEHVSPTLLRLPNGTWRMWTNGYPSYTLTMWEAPNPEGPWSNPTPCTGVPGLWHMNIARSPDGTYRMLYNNSPRTSIRAASSSDGITWTAGPSVILPNPGSWDSTAFYRAALTFHEDGDRYRVWYSGSPGENAWGVGYTEIPLTEWPAPPPPA